MDETTFNYLFKTDKGYTDSEDSDMEITDKNEIEVSATRKRNMKKKHHSTIEIPKEMPVKYSSTTTESRSLKQSETAHSNDASVPSDSISSKEDDIIKDDIKAVIKNFHSEVVNKLNTVVQQQIALNENISERNISDKM